MKILGFGGVGGAMTLLAMLLIAITNECLNWNEQISYCFAYITTLFLSYILNSKYVFKVDLSLKKFGCYCGIYISGMFIGMALLKVSTLLLPTFNVTLLNYLIIPITMAWNFIFINKILTFKRSNKNG